MIDTNELRELGISKNYRPLLEAAAEIDQLREQLAALNRSIIVDCSCLHHDAWSRHDGATPCPVEQRVRAALEGR